MQINYFEIGIVVLLVIGLIIWLIVRNGRDEEVFEKDELRNTVNSPDPERE